MSEPPVAPPPPEPPQHPGSVPPAIQPQYTVPSANVDRWLGARAQYFGIGAGTAVYVLGYLITAVLTFVETDQTERQLAALGGSILTEIVATPIVLVAAIVLMAIPRTRPFGAGLAISLAIGILCGGGVCTALLFAVSR